MEGWLLGVQGRGKNGELHSDVGGKTCDAEEAKKECERQNQLANDPGAVTCECQWEASANSKCTDKCYAEHDAGHEKCNKVKDKEARAKCHQAVNEQLATCINKCNKKKGD